MKFFEVGFIVVINFILIPDFATLHPYGTADAGTLASHLAAMLLRIDKLTGSKMRYYQCNI